MRLNPDSIPTSEQVRETLFDRYYYPYKRLIWGVAIVGIVVILGILVTREWRTRQVDEAWSRFYSASDIVAAPRAPEAEQRRALEERITVLQRLVTDFPQSTVTPFALQEIVSAKVGLKRYDEAQQELAKLRSGFPDFVFSRATTADLGDGGSGLLADRLDASLRSEAKWVAATAYVHPEPTKNRLALIETTAGSFWVGFYPEQAPAHVENFVSLAKSGWFNGTQIYQTRLNTTGGSPVPLAFEGGSAASKVNSPTWVADPAGHDADEPDATIDPEDSRYTIRHRRGVLSAVSMSSGESSRRFMVVTSPTGLETSYNGLNTVFAAVVDKGASLSTIDQIAAAPTYGSVPESTEHADMGPMRDHPYPAIYIRRVTIWKDEVIEPGHTWDTARAAKPEAEPWEATLPTPPKPGEKQPPK